MRISFGQFQRQTFIEEIKNYKRYLMSEPLKKFKDDMINEIDENWKKFEAENKGMDFYEFEAEADEVRFQNSMKSLMCYRLYSSLYQNIFSIWELQVQDSYTPVRLDYNDKITEFKTVVNVLKHGSGRSYDFLKRIDSKYLQEPKEFPYLLPNVHSGRTLNLEFKDLPEFCDTLIKAWEDIDREKRAEELEPNA